MTISIQVQIYHDILLSVKRGSYKGKPINAKPLLLLAALEAIEKQVVLENQFYFSAELEDIYKEISSLNNLPITPFFKPFYYLSYDEFWHLKWKSVAYNERHPSPNFLRSNIEYAYLDGALWDLLQDKETRDYFRKAIEDYYLK